MRIGVECHNTTGTGSSVRKASQRPAGFTLLILLSMVESGAGKGSIQLAALHSVASDATAL